VSEQSANPLRHGESGRPTPALTQRRRQVSEYSTPERISEDNRHTDHSIARAFIPNTHRTWRRRFTCDGGAAQVSAGFHYGARGCAASRGTDADRPAPRSGMSRPSRFQHGTPDPSRAGQLRRSSPVLSTGSAPRGATVQRKQRPGHRGGRIRAVYAFEVGFGTHGRHLEAPLG
jgi:hypothetical protein